MIAIIGGVVVLLVIVAIVFFMYGDGASPAPSPEPEVSEQEAMEQEQEIANAVTGDEDDKPVEIAKVEVASDAPDVNPKDVDGIVGWYDGESYDEGAGEWKDKSGNDFHATEVLGEPEVVEENGMKFVIGGRSDGIRFPTTVMTTGKKFTMFHVTRYTSTEPAGTGRIFDGYGGGANFLSGYHNGHRNRNYFGGSHRSGSGWIADNGVTYTDETVDNFNLSVDQKHLFRWNGRQRSGFVTFPMAKIPTQMTINYGDYTNNDGNNQSSSWAVAEVIFYNKELDLPTIKKIENYLMKKYKIAKEVRVYDRNYSRWTYESGASWLKPLDDCSGSDCESHWKSLANMGSSCGEDGALARNFMHRHGSASKYDPYGPKSEGKTPSNGRHETYSWCLTGLQQGGISSEKESEYISTTDNKPWQEKMKKFDINCRQNPISGYDYELSSDGSRLRMKYQCSSAPIDEQSCRDIEAIRHGNRNDNNERDPSKGLLSSLETQDLNCGSAQVLTKIEYGEDDAGNVLYKGRCCSLQDL